jgi:hypothetical protein
MTKRRKLPTVEEKRAQDRAAGAPLLTPAHHDLICMLAEVAVDEYVAEQAVAGQTATTPKKKSRRRHKSG